VAVTFSITALKVRTNALSDTCSETVSWLWTLEAVQVVVGVAAVEVVWVVVVEFDMDVEVELTDEVVDVLFDEIVVTQVVIVTRNEAAAVTVWLSV
jgi:hypothetical protein